MVCRNCGQVGGNKEMAKNVKVRLVDEDFRMPKQLFINGVFPKGVRKKGEIFTISAAQFEAEVLVKLELVDENNLNSVKESEETENETDL